MNNYVTIKDNKVISIRQGQFIVEGEIENINNLQCGMELIDGEWKFPIPSSQSNAISLEELKDNQLILMDVLATMFEGMLEKGTV